MKIIGELRPVSNKVYIYKIANDKGQSVKASSWEVQYNGQVLTTNLYGQFRFDISLAGKNLKLVAKVIQNGKTIPYFVFIVVLAGIPKILSLKWQDQDNRDIGTRTVGYLDKVQLVIKTINIPVGDTLSVTIYEDEYADGHGDSSRNMGTYTTSAVKKNGYAYLYFNNLQLYRKKLMKTDFPGELTHEYYAEVVYRSHIDKIIDGVQLNITNHLVQLIKPVETNKPVVVATVDKKDEKSDKKKVNVTFNVFFDGTMNNRTNTTEGINKSSIYYKKSDEKDDSYTNFYSNVALLYMNNDVKQTEDIIKIYTEGVGTADKKQDQAFPGGALGTSISIYMRGIKDKVARGLQQMGEFATTKYFNKDKEIGKVTINVFGFSRGAAGARYFLSQEEFIRMYLKLKSIKDISFNFVGLFDTVASYGVIHLNDVSDLHLKLKGKPKKVVQLAAADEYRSNFKSTDITSSIKAGVGYELTMPGVHSDIGGGYSETLDEKRYLGKFVESGETNFGAMKKFETIKSKYIKEGWYTSKEFIVEKEVKNYSTSQNPKYNTFSTLYGNRRGIKNTYQYIPFAIMKTFCEKYGKMVFKDNTDILNSVDKNLTSVKQQLYNYAISNDGINALKVTLPHNELMLVRNRYLHRSNKDDEYFTMSGSYDVNGNPNRDILEG